MLKERALGIKTIGKSLSVVVLSKSILQLLALAFLLLYIVLAIFRMQHPYELQFLESGIVDQVNRVMNGQKMYVSPTLEYTPFIYGPLYFYVSAVFAQVFGLGLFSLRLVSFLAIIGCFGWIFLIVRRETNNVFPALLAAGLFAATYRLSGAWFELARVDSLFLFFLLAGLYFLRFRQSILGYILAALFFFLAYLTKQTTLLICLPLMGYTIFLNWRKGIVFIGAFGGLIGVSTLLLNYFYDGWYSYYTVDLPSRHAIEFFLIGYFWIKDIISPLPIACILLTFYLAGQFRRIKEQKDTFWFYSLTLIGMLGGAWSGRLHSGGSENVLFPAYAAIAILFGLAIPISLQFVSELPTDKRTVSQSFIYCLCTIQFVVLFYNPLDQLPSKKDVEAGRKFISQVSQIKGEVYIPYHNYLATLAGKKSYAHGAALGDVIRGDSGPIKDKLVAEIRQALRDQKFNTLILDTDWSIAPFDNGMFQKNVYDYYKQKQDVFDDKSVFFTITDLKTRPEYIYVPK